MAMVDANYSRVSARPTNGLVDASGLMASSFPFPSFSLQEPGLEIGCGDKDPVSHSNLSDRRLAKHQFRKEADLVSKLSIRWGCLFDALEVFPQYAVEPHIKLEWSVGRRIADLVAFAMRPGWQDSASEVLHALARLAFADSMVLAHINQVPMKMERLKQTVFMMDGEVEAIVASLQSKQLISKSPDGIISPAGDWTQWLPHSLHFVEAKMDDWREAIEQSVYYQTFADAVSVALPMSFEGREDVAGACRTAGVGLVFVPVDGPLRIGVKAQNIHMNNTVRKTQCSMQIMRRVVLDFLNAKPF